MTPFGALAPSLFVLMVLVATTRAQEQPASPESPVPRLPREPRDPRAPSTRSRPAQPLGVLQKRPGAQPGYTLIAPFNSGETLLLDLDGAVVHQWHSEFPPGQSVELLDNGHLLRAARDPGATSLRGGGEGGRIEEFDWDGNLIWSYVCCDEERRQHHDFEVLPNGNVLLIAWENKTSAEVVEVGRDLEAARQGLRPDCLIEVKPTRPEGGTIVWEWHVWDHLIQDRDPTQPNFGVVAEHPERIDINALRRRDSALPQAMSPEEAERLRKLGYLGAEDESAGQGDGGRPPEEAPVPGSPEAERLRSRMQDRGFGPMGGGIDWNHLNSVAYHAGLDHLVMSSHNQHEVWIIDHGTTTAEAATGQGGKRGKGGDLLYRWGNPQCWQAGDAAAQQLFGQHDARWIEPGLRGAGHLLVFNNNVRRGAAMLGDRRREQDREEGREPDWSFVVELELPLQADGTYAREAGKPFAPATPFWRYGGGEGEARFESPIVSGSQRLQNGNTLITSGAEGYCVEVDAQGQVVWEFRSPFGRDTRDGPPEARGGRGGPPEARGGRGGMNSAFYRAIRFAPDHPAFKERELKPIRKPG